MANQKKLKVLLSKDFPLIGNRSTDTFYFLYDKLLVFNGQNQYYDPYAIVQSIPEFPATGILYFILDDGTVRVYTDHDMKILATIETAAQLELLKQSGGTFFVSSDKRHLDLQRRLVTLPYLNGKYELTVDLAKEVVIDHDTVIRFDPKTNCFLIDNNKISDTYFHSGGYRGKETDTVKNIISDMRISSEIKVSQQPGNIIQVRDDGLFADAMDRVRKEQFEDWAQKYYDYKVEMEGFLNNLRIEIDKIADVTSVDSIIARIDKALEEAFPEINIIVESYNMIAGKLDGMERDLYSYAEERYSNTREELVNAVLEASNNPWDTFANEIDEYLASGDMIGA